jgi:hypothetical protein
MALLHYTKAIVKFYHNIRSSIILKVYFFQTGQDVINILIN